MKAIGVCLGMFGIVVVIGGAGESFEGTLSWFVCGLGECAGLPILVGLAIFGADVLMYGKFPWD